MDVQLEPERLETPQSQARRSFCPQLAGGFENESSGDPSFRKICQPAIHQPSRRASDETREENADFIQLLGNASFAVWVSLCVPVSQTGMTTGDL